MKKLNSFIITTFFLALLFSCSIAQSDRKFTTLYTDLTAEKCKTIELDESGSGFYRGECPGVGGYKLELIESDIRQTINVILPDGRKAELDLRKNVSYAFSELGEKAEWRVVQNGKNIKPIALIVRYNASEDPTSSKVTSRLVVAKITEGSACITDVVEPIKNANMIARNLADASADKPCKFDSGVDSEQRE